MDQNTDRVLSYYLEFEDGLWCVKSPFGYSVHRGRDRKGAQEVRDGEQLGRADKLWFRYLSEWIENQGVDAAELDVLLELSRLQECGRIRASDRNTTLARAIRTLGASPEPRPEHWQALAEIRQMCELSEVNPAELKRGLRRGTDPDCDADDELRQRIFASLNSLN